jgi:putative membrane protein
MGLLDAFTHLLTALPIFIAQFGVALATLVLAVWLVLRVTPADELKLVRQGNLAAAVWTTGTVIAMAMPISAALRFSHSTGEVAVWGALAALIQIATYFAAAAIVGKTRQTLEAGELPSALMVVGMQLGVAFVNAAALSA